MSQRFDYPLSLLFIDIDDFKQINDEYGHIVGDLLLKKLAAVLQEQIRDIDVLCRWGGEEFVILLHSSDKKQAFMMADRLREIISSVTIETGKGVESRTASIGIACGYNGSTGMDEMIDLADEAMFMAKKEGKNRICLAEVPTRKIDAG